MTNDMPYELRAFLTDHVARPVPKLPKAPKAVKNEALVTKKVDGSFEVNF